MDATHVLWYFNVGLAIFNLFVALLNLRTAILNYKNAKANIENANKNYAFSVINAENAKLLKENMAP